MVVVLPLPAGPVSSSLAEKALQFRSGLRGQTQFSQWPNAGAIEEAEDDLLAGHGGVGCYADVGSRIEARLVDAPILGQRLLVGLEPGEELDAAKDALGDRGG